MTILKSLHRDRRFLVGVLTLGLASFFLSPSEVFAEGGGVILWEGDFSQSPIGPATDFGPKLEIREENNLKVLSKLDSETEFLFAKNLKSSDGIAWQDYIFTVRYREPEKSTVALVVKANGERTETPYMQYYIGILPTGISLVCHGIPADTFADDPRRESLILFENIGASNLPAGEWITAKVAVGEEVIKVSVDAGDGQTREVEFKAFPGTGSVSILSRSPIDIESVSVRAAGEAVMPKP